MPQPVSSEKFIPKRSYAVLSHGADASTLNQKSPLYESGAYTIPPIGYRPEKTAKPADCKPKDDTKAKKSLSIAMKVYYFLFGLPLPENEPFFSTTSPLRITIRYPLTILPHAIIVITLLPVLNYLMKRPMFSSSYGIAPGYWLEAASLGFLLTLLITSPLKIIQSSSLLSANSRRINIALLGLFFLYGVLFGGMLDIALAFFIGMCVRIESISPPSDIISNGLSGSVGLLDSAAINGYIKVNITKRKKK